MDCKIYPTNYLIIKDGAGSGNRTRVACLEGRNFTIKLYPQNFLEKYASAEGSVNGYCAIQPTCGSRFTLMARSTEKYPPPVIINESPAAINRIGNSTASKDAPS